MSKKKIVYTKVSQPVKDCVNPIGLSDATILERKEKILSRMKERNLDKIIVYCDCEHAWNFAYLVGYYTRFEEALMVMNAEGEVTLMLGNENLNKSSKSRVEAKAVHVSLFSLPNQPMRKDKKLLDLLKEAGIKENEKVGIVGWKLFTSTCDDVENYYDVPSYIVDSIKKITPNIVNATSIYIGENGARNTNNANEIAHYEYGASLASDSILDAMNAINEGVSEFVLGDKLVRNGQHTTITTIASTGPRFVKANMFPSNRNVKVGDPISLTVGYMGGSSSRAGYAVENREQLPKKAQNYMEDMAIPYFNAYVNWLEKIEIGKTGKDMFDLVDTVLPRAIYNWSLCPGHLIGEEEWLCSPIYENSKELIQSGMMFQIDIIPSNSDMAGCSAESTVVIADKQLKKDIQEQYPEMWSRMQNRISYLKNELGIELSEDVLPMCSTVAYLRPYLLNKEKALKVKK